MPRARLETTGLVIASHAVVPSSHKPLLVCLGAVFAVVAVVSACDKDEESPRLSRRGEACQVTNDCSAGLACAPIPGNAGGMCVTGDFHVRPTSKDCAVVQCSKAVDCC